MDKSGFKSHEWVSTLATMSKQVCVLGFGGAHLRSHSNWIVLSLPGWQELDELTSAVAKTLTEDE